MVEQFLFTAVPPEIVSLVEPIGWRTLAYGLVIVLLGWIANKISNRMIAKGMEKRNTDEHVIKTGKKISAFVIYGITFLLILGVFGLPLSSIGAAVGLIGLGVSFALKDLIANFISGMFILVNRPFKIGDQIEINGESGTVRDIRIRATDIKTYDGRKVIVPNSTLYNDIVINNTAYQNRRFEVIVGISYNDDIEKARELAEESLEEADRVRDHPRPKVLVKDLDDSSVGLRLWGWTRSQRADQLEAASEVTELVKNKYDENGIDIPFPIRTVIMQGDEQPE